MVRGSTNTVRSSSNTPEHGSWLHEHCSWQFEHSPDMVRGASHTVCMHACMHPPMLLIPSSAEFVVCLVCDHSVSGVVWHAHCVYVWCVRCVWHHITPPQHTHVWHVWHVCTRVPIMYTAGWARTQECGHQNALERHDTPRTFVINDRHAIDDHTLRRVIIRMLECSSFYDNHWSRMLALERHEPNKNVRNNHWSRMLEEELIIQECSNTFEHHRQCKQNAGSSSIRHLRVIIFWKCSQFNHFQIIDFWECWQFEHWSFKINESVASFAKLKSFKHFENDLKFARFHRSKLWQVWTFWKCFFLFWQVETFCCCFSCDKFGSVESCCFSFCLFWTFEKVSNS